MIQKTEINTNMKNGEGFPYLRAVVCLYIDFVVITTLL